MSLTVLAAFTAVWAGYADVPSISAAAPAKIRIINQLTLTKVTDLDFGTIAIGSTSSNVTLAPVTGRVEPTVSGNAVVLGSSNPTAAKLSVSGYENSTFVITIPTTVSLSDIGGNGGASMIVTLSCDQPGIAPTFTSTLVNGAKDFYLGGTLSIGTNQAPSTYQGSFSVSVNYN